MSLRIVVTPNAEADIAEAASWYAARATGLAGDFLRAVDVILADICQLPERYPVVHTRCRRALLRRFPYGIFYLIGEERITVIACMSTRRHPRWWADRADEI